MSVLLTNCCSIPGTISTGLAARECTNADIPLLAEAAAEMKDNGEKERRDDC